MSAPILIREKSNLLFPNNQTVSLSEYRNNIALAENSGNMTFSEFKNRMDLWEKSL